MTALAGASFPFLSDPDGATARSYGVFDLLGDGVATPGTFIVEQEGSAPRCSDTPASASAHNPAALPDHLDSPLLDLPVEGREGYLQLLRRLRFRDPADRLIHRFLPCYRLTRQPSSWGCKWRRKAEQLPGLSEMALAVR